MEKDNLPEVGGLDIRADKSHKIVIGDIHGCYYTLQNLLLELGSEDGYMPPKGFKIISLGDLNNKGANSIQVLNWAMEQQKLGNLYAVDSNHGRRLARRLNHSCKPGGEVERTYREIRKLNNPNYNSSIINFLSSLPAFIHAQTSDKNEYYVAHAAGSERLFTQSSLSKRERNFLLGAQDFRWSGAKLIITGHVTVKNPTKEIHSPENGTVIRLDTGVNEGNLLSCYLPESDKFVSVKSDLRDL